MRSVALNIIWLSPFMLHGRACELQFTYCKSDQKLIILNPIA